MRSKIDFIMQFNELTTRDLTGQGEQALPGYSKYKLNQWYKYMFSRYLFALKYIKDKKVLDCGCGYGWGDFLISDAAKSLLAIDISSNALQFARKMWPLPKNVFRNHSFFELDKLNESFDTVISFEILEHLSYKEARCYIQKVEQAINKNGIFIISSIFPETSAEAMDIAKKNKYHLHIFTKSEIIHLLDKFGFKIKQFYGNFIIIAQKQNNI